MTQRHWLLLWCDTIGRTLKAAEDVDNETGMGWFRWALQTAGQGHQLFKPSRLLILSDLVFPHFCLLFFCCCFFVFFFKLSSLIHSSFLFIPCHFVEWDVACPTACMWRSEDNLEELVLSFYHVSFKHGAQVLGLGSKSSYLPSHLAGPSTSDFCSIFKVLALSKPHPENY